MLFWVLYYSRQRILNFKECSVKIDFIDDVQLILVFTAACYHLNLCLLLKISICLSTVTSLHKIKLMKSVSFSSILNGLV